MSNYCIENDLPRQQELEAIRQAKIYKEKDESLQQAHRHADESAKDAHRRGWEQCQREAVVVANKRYMATDIIEGCGRVWCSAFGQLMKDINAMEYKEPTND